MEDLIESVMGNIQDEYDDEEAEYSRIDEDNFDLEGTMLLDDVAEILNIEFPDELDYDTLGGFITDMLGRIPEESEHPVPIRMWNLPLSERRSTALKRFTLKFFFRRKSQKKNSQKYKNPCKWGGDLRKH